MLDYLMSVHRLDKTFLQRCGKLGGKIKKKKIKGMKIKVIKSY